MGGGVIGVNAAFIIRYIGDYAGIWTHGEQAPEDFLAAPQRPASEPKVHIGTFRRRGQGALFLDTLVTVEKNNGVTKSETEIFIKPMNYGIILNADSAHTSSTKHNVARN